MKVCQCHSVTSVMVDVSQGDFRPLIALRRKPAIIRLSQAFVMTTSKILCLIGSEVVGSESVKVEDMVHFTFL